MELEEAKMGTSLFCFHKIISQLTLIYYILSRRCFLPKIRSLLTSTHEDLYTLIEVNPPYRHVYIHVLTCTHVHALLLHCITFCNYVAANINIITAMTQTIAIYNIHIHVHVIHDMYTIVQYCIFDLNCTWYIAVC